jgi:hypothetical protein
MLQRALTPHSLQQLTSSSVRDLLLPLPLSVPAVILTLSEVEWGRIPKNSTSQNHPYLSTHTFYVFAVVCSLQPRSKTLVTSKP